MTDKKFKEILSEIQSDIQLTENKSAIHENENFIDRVEAIDFIEFHIIDRINGLIQTEELNVLKERAEKVKRKLEEIDTNLFLQLRNEISKAENKQNVFQKIIKKYIGVSVDNINCSDNAGYDHLDIFIDGLLSCELLPQVTKEGEMEMVFYQKTPARIVFEMMRMAKIKSDAIFFDLGSGLGQVTLLANLIGGTNAKGVEYEPAYCQYARECATQLNLPDVEFINADARNLDYSDGSLFFMYTPFRGKMLEEMLEILRNAATKKSIRIYTYGECSFYAAQQNWLVCTNGKADNLYKLYEFKSLVEKPI